MMNDLVVIDDVAPLAKIIGDDRALKAGNAFLQSSDPVKLQNEMRFLGQIMRSHDKEGKTNMLAACTPLSIMDAIVNVAACGVTLNPAVQHAFLVPRKGECKLDFSYRGLVDLACRGGQVRAITAGVVYDCDEFNYQLGTGAFIDHKPLALSFDLNESGVEKVEAIAANPWAHIKAVWMVAKLEGGLEICDVMPRWKIEKAKKCSKTQMVWNSHPEEQARKTGVKHFFKMLPISESAAVAASLANDAEGFDLSAANQQKQSVVLVSDDQAATLDALCQEVGETESAFCSFFQVNSFWNLPDSDFDEARTMLESKRG